MRLTELPFSTHSPIIKAARTAIVQASNVWVERALRTRRALPLRCVDARLIASPSNRYKGRVSTTGSTCFASGSQELARPHAGTTKRQGRLFVTPCELQAVQGRGRSKESHCMMMGVFF